MDIIEEVGKKLPYVESEDYLDSLIKSTTENAVAQRKPKVIAHRWRIAIATAASLALLVTAGVAIMKHHTATVANENITESPVDEFLNGLSDDDVQLLSYYDIEEIPEY